jgi:hypothetical protein
VVERIKAAKDLTTPTPDLVFDGKMTLPPMVRPRHTRHTPMRENVGAVS